MNLEFSQRAGIWVGLAVIILVFGGYFGVISGLNYLESQSTSLKEARAFYIEQNDRLEKLRDFDSKMEEAKEIVSLMNEALPVAEQKMSTITILDSIASRSGATMLNMTNESSDDEAIGSNDELADGEPLASDETDSTYSSNQTTPEVNNEQLNITLSGSYSSFKKFFSALEDNRRPMSVSSFQLSPGVMEVTLTSYYLK